MGRPTTLLEGLCGHALSLGPESIEVKYKDGREWVFANKKGMGIGIANYTSFQRRFERVARKPLRRRQKARSHRYRRTRLHSQSPHPREFWRGCLRGKHRSGAKARSVYCTAIHCKTRSVLAFIYNYTKIYRQAPAESDLERYFRVSPAIHDMIKTLERNGLIERTPGIRLLLQPEVLPRLE